MSSGLVKYEVQAVANFIDRRDGPCGPPIERGSWRGVRKA
jgi:hypothetical protein